MLTLFLDSLVFKVLKQVSLSLYQELGVTLCLFKGEIHKVDGSSEYV